MLCTKKGARRQTYQSTTNKELENGAQTKKKTQQLLDFENVIGLREFTRAGVLHTVAKLTSEKKS
jgi:hypothetical protein